MMNHYRLELRPDLKESPEKCSQLGKGEVSAARAHAALYRFFSSNARSAALEWREIDDLLRKWTEFAREQPDFHLWYDPEFWTGLRIDWGQMRIETADESPGGPFLVAYVRPVEGSGELQGGITKGDRRYI
jgi:hypothetical protein